MINDNFTPTELDNLAMSDEYADYIMANGDPSEVVVCNGDTLLEAMERGYLFNEFLATLV